MRLFSIHGRRIPQTIWPQGVWAVIAENKEQALELVHRDPRIKPFWYIEVAGSVAIKDDGPARILSYPERFDW